ncbi:MAG: hypothetical protein QGI83_10055 [Candidatus Latescibacteria bacterium]|jgi:hypothetical protein|nr:hypothetical protein [Candidatus Latescibacterota bacterium]
MMVRVRVYRSDGTSIGEIQSPAEVVQRWLAGLSRPETSELCDVRDLMDPDHENLNYDWDVWARPEEVSQDFGGRDG